MANLEIPDLEDLNEKKIEEANDELPAEILDESDEELERGLEQIKSDIIANAQHSTEPNDEPDDVPINANKQQTDSDTSNDSDTKTADKAENNSRPQSKKMRNLGVKTIVREGNDLQKTLFSVAYHLRTARPYETAKADLEMLMDKVATGQNLSQHDIAVMIYARKFISNYESEKDNYENNTGLDEERQLLLQEYGAAYLEETGKEIPAWLGIAAIIGSQLASNVMGIIVPPAPYNPPTQ